MEDNDEDRYFHRVQYRLTNTLIVTNILLGHLHVTGRGSGTPSIASKVHAIQADIFFVK